MVDHAQGFITDDGVFFKDKENAVLYEARRNLSVKYRSSLWCDDMPYTVWLDTLDVHRDEILAYLEALRNVQNLQPNETTEDTPS